MALSPILTEIKPSAGGNVTLYTVNIGEAVQGTVFCTNQSSTDDQISVALVSNGNVQTSNSYICYQTTAYYGQPIYLQEIYLGSQDSVNVASINGTSAFTFTGYKFS